MGRTIREHIVRELTQAMNDGVEVYLRVHEDANITMSELYSAQLTLLATSIGAMKELGTPISALRTGIEQILLRCADDAPGKVN